ncbi:aryl-sulfate sulfotransferase [Natronomonas sp. EA1]|uniref:aryl-sulfate sulfotransferase n=1 Tax=Natronomonas sp. EA1 TaxID=3421655 RepID=UPI003EB7D48D
MRFALVCVLLLLAPAGVGLVGPAAAQSTAPCAGTIDSPAQGVTVVSVQGARFDTSPAKKTTARLVGFGPRGEIKWVYETPRSLVWSYDVDPLPNGNLFVTGTRPDETVFFEFDPRTQERVWTEVLPLVDTHDADLLPDGRIAIANMRAYDESADRNDDRLLIYNRTSEEYEQEWLFREHFSKEIGGQYEDDWTHVNDIDRVNAHEYLLSPRNFDVVILVNVTSGEVVHQLGEYGNHAVLEKQHNPVLLDDETILVADSDNNRVAEYRFDGEEWERTWTLGSRETLHWPRDADRLPNGNTLVGDSKHNRVLEVTPEGEVVWEAYAPWLVYDVERVPYGDEAGGPTIAEQGAEGRYAVTGGDVWSTAKQEACVEALKAVGPNEVRQVSGAGGTEVQPRSATPTRGAGAGFGAALALATVGLAVLARAHSE